MSSFLETFIVTFLVLIIPGVAFVLIRHRNRKRRSSPVQHTTAHLCYSQFKVNPYAISGTVRIPTKTAEMLQIESGIEGMMYRDSTDRLLPAKGFGERRALPVMISNDDSLRSGEMVISEEDARTLRLGSGGLVRLKYTDPRPPKTYRFHAYRGKIPILGLPSPKITLHPFGPHKVRVPEKTKLRPDDETHDD